MFSFYSYECFRSHPNFHFSPSIPFTIRVKYSRWNFLWKELPRNSQILREESKIQDKLPSSMFRKRKM